MISNEPIVFFCLELILSAWRCNELTFSQIQMIISVDFDGSNCQFSFDLGLSDLMTSVNADLT